MKSIVRIISDNSGKIGFFVIFLGIIIALAATAWGFVLLGYFGGGGAEDQLPDSQVTMTSEGDYGEYLSDDQLSTDAGSVDLIATPTPSSGREPGEYSDILVLDIFEAFPDIYSELEAIAQASESIAVSMALYDGQTGEYFTYEYGYADVAAQRRVDRDTKFNIASLSKLVTAICALTLVDGGYIELDTDVSTYFGYQVENPNFPDTPITARMLMQHTSSIFDSGAFQVSRDRNSSESVKYLIERGSSFRRNRPGSNSEYTNFGFAVLGALCERVSGKSLDTLAREVIFDPLGIDAAYVPSKLQDTENIAVIYDSSHAVSRSVQSQLEVAESDSLGHDLHLAQSNLTISARDYAMILNMLSNGGVFFDEAILSSASVNEMHVASVVGAGYDQGFATRYSTGEFIGDEGFYWHTGSLNGVFSQYVYSMEDNRGVAVITSGASVNRLDNSMIDVCTELSRAAWRVFDSSAIIDDGTEG